MRSWSPLARAGAPTMGVAAFALGLGLAGTAGMRSEPERATPTAVEVAPLAYETAGNGRNVDDPCFWADPRDPGASLLLATAKDAARVDVFAAATGAVVGRIAGFARPNDCVVEGDRLYTTDAGVPEVAVHALPSLARVGGFGADMRRPQGIDVLTTPDGRALAYVTDGADASVHVYDLASGRLVRAFPTGFGAGVEPIVADDRHQRIFVARGAKEEPRRIGVFTPEGAFVREIGGAVFSGDVEGLAIYACDAGGYLIAADQNRAATALVVFDRERLDHVGTFRLRNARGEATAATDGIAVLQAPLPGYAAGVLAVADGCGSTARDEVDVVDWQRVAMVMGLDRCPGGGPPACGDAPCARRIVASADAYVTREAPLTNFGTAPTLDVKGKAGDTVETFLRFDVPPLDDFDVVGARIRLTVDRARGADGAAGGRLFRASDAWTEESVTFARKPASVRGVVATAGRVRRDAPVDFDVGAVVRGSGPYAFALLGNAKDRVRYRSREAADHPPTLILALRARRRETHVAADVASTAAAPANVAREDAR